MKFLALDSGSKKWGYALFDDGKVIDKGIIESDALEETLLRIRLREKPDFIVVGRRRGALENLAFLKDINIITVSEMDTTLEARDLYFSENPPKGLMKLLPKGLRVPERAVDDFAAVIIGKRFLNSLEGIYMFMRETVLKDMGGDQDLWNESFSLNSFAMDCCEGLSKEGYVLEVSFRGTKGRAFTRIKLKDGEVKLREIFGSNLSSYKDRVQFLALLNAIYRYLGKVNGTIHCSPSEWLSCGDEFVSFVSKLWGRPKVCLVGYNEVFLERFKKAFKVRLIDLEEDESEVLEWAEVFVLTGEAFLNGMISKFLTAGKPMVIYGPMGAVCSFMFNIERFCPFSK